VEASRIILLLPHEVRFEYEAATLYIRVEQLCGFDGFCRNAAIICA
jgi:hypothetical protein